MAKAGLLSVSFLQCSNGIMPSTDPPRKREKENATELKFAFRKKKKSVAAETEKLCTFAQEPWVVFHHDAWKKELVSII